MSNPAPIYVVNFDGSNLPGYVQSEDIPFALSSYGVRILNRDGGFMGDHGAEFREVSLTFRVLSRLSVGTGMDHLNDCKDQWRDALRLTARKDDRAALKIGETDRYINARFVGSTAPLEAPALKRISYTLKFLADPWFLGTTVSGSQSVSGNTSITLAMDDTRKTYPIITIPTGITAITASHTATGKSFELSGGPWSSALVVDCGALTITQASVNGVGYLASGPDFGFWHQGAGNFTVNLSGVSGSGTISIIMQHRFER